ncbi:MULTISPECIES: helix-turn-helix domain-containing protein [unclassified Bradyrhizobium]|uniref:MarR family transcriptional regulator n=1 Tax=unclassified Bradyrhizobium TaxID=2631580 RepID=UPI0033928FD9
MSLQNRRVTKGRHPLLKIGMLSGRIFRELKEKGDMTITQIANSLKEEYQSVNAQVQRLKSEGLVISVPTQKGNRTVSMVRAVTENETSFARDKVEIETTVYVNAYGEYSAISRVINQLPTATEDEPKPVHVHRHYIAVPRPSEPAKTRQMFDKEFKGGVPSDGEGTVIDGDFSVIDGD